MKFLPNYSYNYNSAKILLKCSGKVRFKHLFKWVVKFFNNFQETLQLNIPNIAIKSLINFQESFSVVGDIIFHYCFQINKLYKKWEKLNLCIYL